jgi:hypothetical protein
MASSNVAPHILSETSSHLCKQGDQGMSGIMRRKVAKRTFPPLDTADALPSEANWKLCPRCKRKKLQKSSVQSVGGADGTAATALRDRSAEFTAQKSKAPGSSITRSSVGTVSEKGGTSSDSRKPRSRCAWTETEDNNLREAVTSYGEIWVQVAKSLPGRTND